MTNCQRIMGIMEEIAPRRLAEDWDNPGLLVGSPRQNVDKILVALDISERVVDTAIVACAQLIVTHHPLIFKPLKKIRTDLPSGKLLKKILQNDLAVFAAHTNLDAAQDGVNDVLAQKLALTDVKQLLDSQEHEPGLGRVGILPQSMTLEELALHVENALALPNLRLVSAGNKPVRKLAVCGGSAAEFIDKAAWAGADAYLTGDVRYHDAQRAVELGLHLIDAGHFGTEFPIVSALAERLRQKILEAQLGVQVVADDGARDFFAVHEKR